MTGSMMDGSTERRDECGVSVSWDDIGPSFIGESSRTWVDSDGRGEGRADLSLMSFCASWVGSSDAERLGEEESDCMEGERCLFLEPVWRSLTASFVVVCGSGKDIEGRGGGTKSQITRLNSARRNNAEAYIEREPVLANLKGGSSRETWCHTNCHGHPV